MHYTHKNLNRLTNDPLSHTLRLRRRLVMSDPQLRSPNSSGAGLPELRRYVVS